MVICLKVAIDTDEKALNVKYDSVSLVPRIETCRDGLELTQQSRLEEYST